jgi:hypothetical protein
MMDEVAKSRGFEDVEAYIAWSKEKLSGKSEG